MRASVRGGESWRAGWSVRRDWPDGSHEFVGFYLGAGRAGWAAVADARFWRRSHVRPVCSAVVISGRDFMLHRRRLECRAPDCPVGTDRTALVGLVSG